MSFYRNTNNQSQGQKRIVLSPGFFKGGAPPAAEPTSTSDPRRVYSF
ncbi:hypothetical protein DFA_00960 [Cavenderia fasciculata]|uniref:Uncharacterized protein n=1 Tax=Cavenderia fasciculata TaxID=261658 RepID=F4PUR6_CACFS|nr:uncharacterized protein DFA_00960 [Cavenderia fasciculata]EGG21085.1 hypothetical protein DFA_00960 [Cavenderia fasciculata]|eukprot:XP_004358935.1 hypothetical protein DFA_00960 [Cavenderia fasciculata]